MHVFKKKIEETQGRMKRGELSGKVVVNEKKQEQPTSFGDKFKPKPGSWECNVCCVRNDISQTSCVSCNSPREPQQQKEQSKGSLAGMFKPKPGESESVSPAPLLSRLTDLLTISSGYRVVGVHYLYDT
jgi:E3 SUMO-protein ligase RanBP2